MLASHGIPVVGERLASDADAAVAAAQALGYPVAVKIELSDIAHNTEAGLIRLGLRDDGGLRPTFEAVVANARKLDPLPRINGVPV